MREAILTSRAALAGRHRWRVTPAEFGVGLVFEYVALGALVYRATGDGSYSARLLQPQFFIALPAGAALSLPVVLMALRRQLRDASGRPIHDAVTAWRQAWQGLSRERVVYVAIVCLLSALFLNAFIAWKSLIPRLHPFAFDAELARWGVALHGGLPFRLLDWVPISLVDPLYYYGWTIGLLAGVLAMAWVQDTRGLLALLLAWILLGTLTATIVSSAGPPYFTAVTGMANPYRDLFVRLATAEHGRPAFALEVQRSLWLAYRSGLAVSGTGISAFPSMHVATAMVFTLAARRRWLRIALGFYTVLILIGSVALGWHYTLDGYGAIVGSLLIWWLSGRLIPPRRGIAGGSQAAA